MFKVIPYILLGYPDIESSYNAINESLEDDNIDFIELGMPSINPFKDGDKIKGFQRELIKNEFYLDDYFNFIKNNFKECEIKKLIPMGYMNDIDSFGIKKFNDKLLQIGFKGIICISDEKNKNACENIQIPLIPVVSNKTIDDLENIKQPKKLPFIYFVSGNGKTGEVKIHASEILKESLNKIRSIISNVPVYAGFGIDSHEKAVKMTEEIGFDGVIVGSELLKNLSKGVKLSDFLKNLRGESL
jgi:tryptophan synthase alpha chain